MGRPKKNSNLQVSTAPLKKIQSLLGLEDIVPESESLWPVLLKRLSRLSRVYGFERVETPLLEDARLYESFYKQDATKFSRTLRLPLPKAEAVVRSDFLPGILRAYHQNKIYEKFPLSKWFFGGFVVSEDEEKNLVSDYQFGLEVFGGFDHLTEAQAVGAVWEFLNALGLKDLVLEINHVGQDECQLAYQETLRDFLSPKKFQLCDNCNEHLQGRTLNVLRCENLDCQALLADAPAVLDFLDETSKKHFTNILEALDELGIPYQLNPLYAGPTGHGKTNVVIKAKLKGVNVVVGEGGYHESLMQNLCGKNYCCFGFISSLSKIKTLLEASKITVSREQKSEVFLVPLGDLAAKKALRLFRDLAFEKISVYDHFGNAGVKNQLKAAETFQAPIALIMGQKEAVDEMVILRDVKSGMQEIISYDKIVQEVKKRLGR